MFGLTALLVSLILEVQTRDVHLTERLRWTSENLIRSLLTPKHLRITVLLACIISVLIGLSYGLSYWLGYNLLNGLFIGLFVGLGYWLLSGLLQGISYEQLEDQDRWRFNQGVRRSIRNCGILGIIGGGMIGIIGILSYVLSYALSSKLGEGLNEWFFGMDWQNNWLSSWLSYVLNYGWQLAAIGGLLACAVNGGLAVQRHYTIRLLLWRSRTFPWRAAPFFEDATTRILLRRIGGGYSFIHRLLRDHFAELNASTLTSQSPP